VKRELGHAFAAHVNRILRKFNVAEACNAVTIRCHSTTARRARQNLPGRWRLTTVAQS